jgi:hypothetical protein
MRWFHLLDSEPVHFWGPKNGADSTKESEIMLWTILVILLILWLLGFLGHIGGGLIHILLVVALIVLIYNLVAGRRTV